MLTDTASSRQTKVLQETTSENGLPSVAHYIKKIFLVSDNDAYNRLYEFVGQQQLNERLWEKEDKDVRITRRFTPMSEEENRHTNPVRFVQDNQLVYAQPANYSKARFDFSQKLLVGNAHYDWDDKLLQVPMDFTTHNKLPLEDLQQILKSVLFPASMQAKKHFHLSPDDNAFVQVHGNASFQKRLPKV